MKKACNIIMAICLALAGFGCAGMNPPPPTFSVNARSAIQLAAYYKYWPEMSGYYLPAGIYPAEREDTQGVFFKAPDGMKLLSLTRETAVQGGIYLPKTGTVGGRGHVYIHMPMLGSTSYLLPDAFFSAYGQKWKLVHLANHETMHLLWQSGHGCRPACF